MAKIRIQCLAQHHPLSSPDQTNSSLVTANRSPNSAANSAATSSTSAQQSVARVAKHSQQQTSSAGSPQLLQCYHNAKSRIAAKMAYLTDFRQHHHSHIAYPSFIEDDMPATATPEFSVFQYHGTYARYLQPPHLFIQNTKMNWQKLEHQGPKKGGGIETSECVSSCHGNSKFAQTMMYHFQCLDTFYFNVKQGSFHETQIVTQSAVREFAHWYPQKQNSWHNIWQMEGYYRDELCHKDRGMRDYQQLTKIAQRHVDSLKLQLDQARQVPVEQPQWQLKQATSES